MRSESNEQGRDSLALQCNNNMLVKGEEITLPLNILSLGNKNSRLLPNGPRNSL